MGLARRGQPQGERKAITAFLGDLENGLLSVPGGYEKKIARAVTNVRSRARRLTDQVPSDPFRREEFRNHVVD